MKSKGYGITDIGMKRSINQDAFQVDEAAGLFVVADGMGGHKGGEVASTMAVQLLSEHCKLHPDMPPEEILDKGINSACLQIHDKAKESEELAGMGTTMLAVLVRDGVAYIGQVGDSRAYLIREEGVWQLTEDHSLLNEEIRAGRLSAGQADSFQFKNIITRSVGYEKQVTVDIYRRQLQDGDILLLCTDGLSGVVNIGELSSPLKEHGMQQGLKKLIDLANERGGEDNITVLGVEVAA